MWTFIPDPDIQLPPCTECQGPTRFNQDGTWVVCPACMVRWPVKHILPPVTVVKE